MSTLATPHETIPSSIHMTMQLPVYWPSHFKGWHTLKISMLKHGTSMWPTHEAMVMHPERDMFTEVMHIYIYIYWYEFDSWGVQYPDPSKTSWYTVYLHPQQNTSRIGWCTAASPNAMCRQPPNSRENYDYNSHHILLLVFYWSQQRGDYAISLPSALAGFHFVGGSMILIDGWSQKNILERKL